MPATDFVHEFEAVVDNAKAGEKIGKTKLSTEIAEIAYDIGLNSGKGAYRTFESGTSIKGNKDMSKLDINNLNYGITNMSTTRGGQSKTDMEVISRTLDAYGRKNNIKYVFVDSIKSPNGKNASGTYSAEDNVVYLSVNSKNPLSVAAGHETFHYMKRNNSNVGQELQEYIINKLKADSSYDYDARVKELSELYGTEDTDAINEEIAANSMFDIFDEATVKDLAKNHKKLFDIVKEKLGEILEYLKNAVKKYADFLGNKEARSNLRNDYEALQSIRDRMDKALEEIKNGESEKAEIKKTETEEKFSIEYTEDDIPVVVVRDNILKDEFSYKDKIKDVKRYFNKFEKIPAHFIEINFTKKSVNEYTRSRYTQNLSHENADMVIDKMKTAGHPYDIVYAITDFRHESPSHPRKDNIVGFIRGDILLDVSGNKYKAETLIALTNRGKYIMYDIVNMREESFKYKERDSQNTVHRKSEAVGYKSLSTDSISDSLKNVNRKFSEKFSLDENEDVVNKYNQVLAENKHLRELNTILREEMQKTPRGKIGKKGEKALTDIAKSLIRKYKSSAERSSKTKKRENLFPMLFVTAH